MSALDIPEKQVAVDFFQDPNFAWHARILLERVGDAGRWVVATPDLEVEVCDLAAHRMVPLVRGAPYPRRIAGQLYGFDPLTDEELEQLRRDAKALAEMLGAVVVSAGTGDSVWVYSDTASELFGEEVDGALLRNAMAVEVRGAVGMVHHPDGWTFMERMLRSDLDAWREEKRTGPGRDPRILPVERDAQDNRFQSLRDAMGEMKKGTGSDNPFRGPPAAPELLNTIRGSGEEVVGYHEYWVRHSGIHAEAAVAHTHRTLLSVLAHMINVDQLNALSLTSAECLCRHIVRIHRAVKRNPKNPDFSGLEVMVTSSLDTGGAILTGEFARWTAEEQKSEAFTLKQQRLFAEEQAKKAPAVGGVDKPPPAPKK